MRCIDVFAGVGGMHMAAARAGFGCIWACEADPDCRDVYGENHGILPLPDIAGVDPDEVPDHELCMAGLPCQAYSIAGLGRGVGDPRAAVLVGLLRILRAKRPEVCMIENVPGLLRRDGGRGFRLIRESLRALGYKVSWQVMAATEFGGATLRRRVYIVGSRCGKFDFARLDRLPAGRLADVLEPGVRDGWLRPDEYTLFDKPRLLKGSGMKFAGFRNKPVRMPGANLKLPGTHRQQNQIWDATGVGPTISSQDETARYWTAVGGRVRKLTRLELVRLQGYPEGFIWSHPHATVRQLGNSVHVPTVAAVCRGIAEQLLGMKPAHAGEAVA
jgi:DNA (cytosine-5)-methyltransferase 1